MSSINLDLGFQDYTPTNSGINRTFTSQQPEVQVRVPSPVDSAANFKQNTQNVKSILSTLPNVSNFQTNQSPDGLSDETLQQLIWLSKKQKNMQQRGSIAASNTWGLGYFAQYLDVTTRDVLQRILWSAVPIRKRAIDFDGLYDVEFTLPLTNNMVSGSAVDNDNISQVSGDQVNNRLFDQLNSKQKNYSYMERFIQSRPDFYGPFWISATLIFSVAIFSNIVSFMDFKSKMYRVNLDDEDSISITTGSESLSPKVNREKLQFEDWHYSIDELNMTASVILFYITLLPTFLWFLFWFRGCTKYYTLTETICAYGYSLSVFIPLSALLMVQAILFRYIVLILASLMSGLVLVMSFLPIIQSNPNKGGSHIILVIIPACQLGLAYILHRIMLH